MLWTRAFRGKTVVVTKGTTSEKMIKQLNDELSAEKQRREALEQVVEQQKSGKRR